MHTSRSILALAAMAALATSCAQPGTLPYGYGAPGGTGTGGTAIGGTGGTAIGGTGGTATGGTGGTATGGTGGTATGGTGGTATGGAGGGTCTPPVPGGACDTSPQCGCSSGQACQVIDTSGKTACTTTGNVGPYQVCNAINSCQVGYTCIGVTTEACKRYCDTAADCPGVGRECIQLQYLRNGTPTDIPGAKICTSGCDPTNPGAICGSGLTCIQVQSSAATGCVAAGTGKGPGGCTKADPTCAIGYLCVVTGSGSYSCDKFCKVGDPGACSGCADLQPPIVIGTTHYGFCP